MKRRLHRYDNGQVARLRLCHTGIPQGLVCLLALLEVLLKSSDVMYIVTTMRLGKAPDLPDAKDWICVLHLVHYAVSGNTKRHISPPVAHDDDASRCLHRGKGAYRVCGIVGFVDQSHGRDEAVQLIDDMCMQIRHRGPDDQGTWVGDGIALGMRRLAIIDLAGGRQPIFNEDQQVVVVFNGEIYNYRSLQAQLRARAYLPD